MSDIHYFESIQNRITKRRKQLFKWARTNYIQYYVCLTDIIECPFIDAIKIDFMNV